jgi:hypothetical protein
VIINGTTVLSHFDILANVAKNQALQEDFFLPGSPLDQYVIQFKSDVNNALVSGIEILTGPTSPCNVNNGGCAINATCSGSGATESCNCPCGYAGNGVTCDPICTPTTCPPGFVCTIQLSPTCAQVCK